MKHHKVITSLAIAAIFAVAISSRATQMPVVDDPIVASFERSLAHEPGPIAVVTGKDVEADVLYELVNRPLQMGDDND